MTTEHKKHPLVDLDLVFSGAFSCITWSSSADCHGDVSVWYDLIHNTQFFKCV